MMMIPVHETSPRSLQPPREDESKSNMSFVYLHFMHI